MVFITIVTGAYKQQLISWGPHIVDMSNDHKDYPISHITPSVIHCIWVNSNDLTATEPWNHG